MKLSYTDILGDNEVKTIRAKVTTDHPSSSYGLPVVVLPDGGALDATSWALLGYKVIELPEKERPLMEKWLANTHAMLG